MEQKSGRDLLIEDLIKIRDGWLRDIDDLKSKIDGINKAISMIDKAPIERYIPK